MDILSLESLFLEFHEEDRRQYYGLFFNSRGFIDLRQLSSQKRDFILKLIITSVFIAHLIFSWLCLYDMIIIVSCRF